jgi:VWFA-related protein
MPQASSRAGGSHARLTAIAAGAVIMVALAALTARAAFAGSNAEIGFSRLPDVQQTGAPQSGTQQSAAPEKPADVAAAPVPTAVSVISTVRDKKGKPVADLGQTDFTLTDDGHPQSIQNFARAGDAPLTLGLLVDTSSNQWHALDQERHASGDFLDKMVREGTDKAFILHFDHEVELLQDLTSTHQKLEKAIASLQTAQPDASTDNNPQNQGSGQGQGGQGQGGQGQGGQWPGSRGGGRHSHSGAQLYDAIYLACSEVIKKIPGRKVLIVFSNGVDRGSKEMLESALEAAQRTDTILYAVHFKDDDEHEGGNRGGFGSPGMGGGGMGRRGGGGQRYPQEDHPDGKKILERISSETGGRYLEVSKKVALPDIYTQIQQDLQSQYSLAYTPVRAEAATTAYHKIRLTVDKKDFVVQARDGYYSDAPH